MGGDSWHAIKQPTISDSHGQASSTKATQPAGCHAAVTYYTGQVHNWEQFRFEFTAGSEVRFKARRLEAWYKMHIKSTFCTASSKFKVILEGLGVRSRLTPSVSVGWNGKLVNLLVDVSN